MAEISKIKLPDISEALIIKDAVARQMIENLPTPMQFKGTLGVGGTISELPTAAKGNLGHVYKVITDGTYAGQAAKVGDVFICANTGTDAAPVYVWVLVPSGDEPSGTVTNIATGAELTGGPITTTGTIAHATSGVTAGTVQGITVNEYGHVIAIVDMGYAPLVSPAFTGNVNMKGADKVEAPIITYASYDASTQANCVVTMDTLMQAINAISKTDIKGEAIEMASSDKVEGNQAIFNSSNTSIEGTALVIS